MSSTHKFYVDLPKSEIEDEDKKNANSPADQASSRTNPVNVTHGAQWQRGKFQVGDDNFSGSDSEKETEILERAEDMQYGVTPPRHARRIKNKSRSVKKELKQQSAPIIPSKDKHKASFIYKRDKEKYLHQQNADINSDDAEQNVVSSSLRKFLTINVDSPNRYRSIKSVPANLDKHEVDSGSSKGKGKSNFQKCRSFHDSFGDYDCPTGRLHFIRKFQIHVKLGDRAHGGRRESIRAGSDEPHSTQNWQIQFDQVLWLELQAWHSGRTIDNQDTYLLEERQKIDRTLDEIIHFHFPTKLKELNIAGHRPHLHHPGAVPLDEKHPRTEEPVFNFDKETSAHHVERPAISTASQSISNQPSFAPHDITHLCSTMQDHFTGSIQQKAMQIIIMLLMKVQDAQSLYPTSKTLSRIHDKFCDLKFLTNFDTLNLWLNICKELYHKLQIIAGLIDIDVEDSKTWADWFDHGLGEFCS